MFNSQLALKLAKANIRAFVRENWSDQKLAEVYAFNADGKMNFHNPCSCLIGVTDSDTLHEDCGWQMQVQILSTGCVLNKLNSDHHYVLCQGRLVTKAWFAEQAYRDLGGPALAQKRLSAILRAEMKRRERVHSKIIESVETYIETLA
jgi:hypothetical protein